MSHIPDSAMPHAKKTEGDTDTKGAQAQANGKATLSDKATDAADRAREAVKANPKTAIGIGAAVVAGIAAAVAAPSVIAKTKAAKKDGAKKSAKAK